MVRMSTLPVVFLNHGGGPLPLMNDPQHSTLIKFLSEDVKDILKSPSSSSSAKAIVLISAHWEVEGGIHVSGMKQPDMIYDYMGFPPETYKYSYPATGGSEELVERIVQLLSTSSPLYETMHHLNVQKVERGFDHGVFVPMMLANPAADIPIVTISLEASLDAEFHLRMGNALKPLRNEGIIIVGSGQSYHNMRAYFNSNPSTVQASKEFDDFLVDVICENDAKIRFEKLKNWDMNSYGKLCHPRPEHLMPLMVCVGTVNEDDKVTAYRHGPLLKHHISSFAFRQDV